MEREMEEDVHRVQDQSLQSCLLGLLPAGAGSGVEKSSRQAY